MSDHDLEPLEPDLAALLDADRGPEAIPAGAKGRVLARAERTLGFGGPGPRGGPADPDGGSAPPSGGGSSPVGAGPGLLGTRLGLAVGAFLLGAAGGAGAVASLRSVPPPQIVEVPVFIPVPTPSLAESAPAGAREQAELPAPAAPASASAPARARPAAAASAPGEAVGRDVDFAAERAVLEIARNAVGRGEGAAALRALERHAAEFRRGRLVEEREALWIQALLLAGRRPEARARAEDFRARFPRSLLRPAIAATLEDAAAMDGRAPEQGER